MSQIEPKFFRIKYFYGKVKVDENLCLEWVTLEIHVTIFSCSGLQKLQVDSSQLGIWRWTLSL